MAVRSKHVQTRPQDELFYVNGNTVLHTKVRPQETVEEPVRRRDWEQLEEEENERRRRNRARREQQRALSYSKVYVAFLSACICVMFLVCGCYLYLQSSLTAHLDTIRDMQNQIIDLRSDNDETLQRIDSEIDLETIKERAMNELGMTYPKSTQIVTYTVDESDTMTQYAEVP